MAIPENPNIFANNPLDRMSEKRPDKAWIAEKMADPTSLFVPFWRLQPFVLPESAPNAGKDVGWLPMGHMKALAGEEPLIVFLGINKRGKALFAADVSQLADPENAPALKGLGTFGELRGFAMAGDLTPGELAILAQAKSMIDWHQRHGYCSVCGTKSVMEDAGYKRVCTSCKAEHFPRTDPVVIMLATIGDKCFVGRQKGWPKGMFSALAGFIEPGEAIEEAVARELREEAGLSIASVTYHSTQPWPYPSSLMIGCHAVATSEDFKVDGIEISMGRWVSREEAKAVLAGTGDGTIWFPPSFAIAHQLIKAFAEGRV